MNILTTPRGRGLLGGTGAGPSLSLPSTNIRGGWEAREVTLSGPDILSFTDVSGNGYTLTRESGLLIPVSAVDGHAAARFEGGRRVGLATFNNGTPGGPGVTRTYYFVGRLDAPSGYRTIFGGGGDWIGTWNSAGGPYRAYAVGGAIVATPPVSTLFQFSMELVTSGTNTLRHPGGTETFTASSSTFQASGYLRIGATNGAFYPMNGDFIAGYVYDGPYDANVPAFISQEWAGA